MKQNLKNIIKNNEPNKEYSLVLVVNEIFRTTDGLNIFTVSDGNSIFKLTKFIPNSVAYGHVQKGDVKEFTFKTKLFQGTLQGDLNNVVDVNSEIIEQFKNELDSAKLNKYSPKDETLLIKTQRFEELKPSMLKASMQIRKAVIEKRPIHITHHNDCDGFGAGIILEQSITNLIKRYHSTERFLRQYISRNPSRTPFYDITDATKDVGFFLGNMQRFNVVAPLIIIVDNGSTKQDLLSIEKVKLYGADVIVIDHHDPGKLDETGASIICEHTLAHVNPHLHGFKEGMSASMLCYQVSYFINRQFMPNIVAATAGGVADRCEGEEIDLFIEKSTYQRDYLWKLAMMVDYEIYMTKMNLQAGGLYTLLTGDEDKRNKLISLYEPLVEEARNEVKESLKKYVRLVQWGNKKVALVDGEQLTLWGDYYTIGKLAGISFDLFEPSIVIVHTDSMMVFRAQQETGFDVNKLILTLKEQLPYGRISGGGHAVAGSIKFLSAVKKELLEYIQKIVEE